MGRAMRALLCTEPNMSVLGSIKMMKLVNLWRLGSDGEVEVNAVQQLEQTSERDIFKQHQDNVLSDR